MSDYDNSEWVFRHRDYAGDELLINEDSGAPSHGLYVRTRSGTYMSLDVHHDPEAVRELRDTLSGWLDEHFPEGRPAPAVFGDDATRRWAAVAEGMDEMARKMGEFRLQLQSATEALARSAALLAAYEREAQPVEDMSAPVPDDVVCASCGVAYCVHPLTGEGTCDRFRVQRREGTEASTEASTRPAAVQCPVCWHAVHAPGACIGPRGACSCTGQASTGRLFVGEGRSGE